jgi:hypothetical protein
MDKQQGLVESRLQPTSSSFTKFATFPKAIIWSLIAWLAIFFLICSANALPTSIKDTLSSVGGKDHFSRRGILSVSSSSNSCQGSLVNWNKALMAVLPTKNLKIETLEGPIYGTIEVRTGDVTNTQRMPEVYFSASVTQNDNTAGLQLNQNAPGSTISTFTLSVAPLPASPVPYCSFVNITVVIPVDATAPYYDGELEFVTEYMDVKTTTNIGQLSIAKFSFRSSLGDLYAPSLRTKTLNATFTEGTVTIDSLRPYDNESPITALIHTSGDIKLAFKTSPASQGTTTDSTPHSLEANGGLHVKVDISPDTEGNLTNITTGEWVPRPVKIEADVDDAILNVVLAEGQKLNMYVKPFWSALVSVVSQYISPFLIKKKKENKKTGTCSICVALFSDHGCSLVFCPVPPFLILFCMPLFHVSRFSPDTTCIAYIH